MDNPFRLQDDAIRTILARDDVGRDELRPDALNRHHGVDRRETFGEGERSGAPRARCINRSPVAFAGADPLIAEAVLIPEGRRGDVKATELPEDEPVGLGKLEHADLVVLDHALRVGMEFR